MQFLDQESVKTALKAKGTKFTTVTFKKKDGTIRSINGLLRAKSHMAGGPNSDKQRQVMQNHNLTPIYSLADRGWRSFSNDAVVKIK